jgi:putative peptide zinc metalloprotease protein
VEVRSGQTVEPNQVLFRLDVPELTVRESKAASSLAAARIEFARAAASERQRERQSVLLEQIGGAIAEEQSVREDAERLVIRSNGRAVVRDVPPEVVSGRWVNPRQLLARLVSTSSATIEAYVAEARIKSVEVGQQVTFIPHSIRASTVKGRVRSIDTVASRRIPRYVLLSPYGGDIPSVVDRRGGATAQDPYYRVLIEAEPGQYPATLVMPGTVRVKIDLEILAENFIFRALSLLIRETAI